MHLKLGVDSDDDVCNFIDRYINCSTPVRDTDLAELISKVQKHRHSGTCKRNGQCRFHYPRPRSLQTVIGRQWESEMCTTDEADKGIAALATVRKTLYDKNTAEDITLCDLLDRAKVSYSTYLIGLKISLRGNSVIMKRQPSESWINHFNPDVMRVWKSNMDLQYISDAYACVM